MSKIVDHLDVPCVIFRTDVNQYMIYGPQVILFKDSKQCDAFIQRFPMFFEFDGDESPFYVYPALDEMINDKEGCVWYDDIADKMDAEEEYQKNKVLENKTMKEALKDE